MNKGYKLNQKICPKCEDKPETLRHFLRECPRLQHVRRECEVKLHSTPKEVFKEIEKARENVGKRKRLYTAITDQLKKRAKITATSADTQSDDETPEVITNTEYPPMLDLQLGKYIDFNKPEYIDDREDNKKWNKKKKTQRRSSEGLVELYQARNTLFTHKTKTTSTCTATPKATRPTHTHTPITNFFRYNYSIRENQVVLYTPGKGSGVGK